MRNWDEVESNPKFQALSDEQKEYAKSQYDFEMPYVKQWDSIKESNDFKGLDAEQQIGAMEQFKTEIYDLYLNNIPSSVRTFGETVLGNRSDITEDDFSEGERERLINAVKKAEKEGRTEISYGDYGEKDPMAIGADAHFKSAVFDEGGSLANTFGTAQFSRDKEGNIIITDKYDFFSTRESVEKAKAEGKFPSVLEAFSNYGVVGVGNLIGNQVVPSGEGREVRIKLNKED